MSGMVDKPPKEDNVIVLDVRKARDGLFVMDLRVRTDNNWMYYRGVELVEGQSFILSDNQPVSVYECKFVNIIEVLSRVGERAD